MWLQIFLELDETEERQSKMWKNPERKMQSGGGFTAIISVLNQEAF